MRVTKDKELPKKYFFCFHTGHKPEAKMKIYSGDRIGG